MYQVAKVDAQLDKASVIEMENRRKWRHRRGSIRLSAKIELTIAVGTKQISANFATPVVVRKGFDARGPSLHQQGACECGNRHADRGEAGGQQGAREPIRRRRTIPTRPQAISGGRATGREPAPARSAATIGGGRIDPGEYQFGSGEARITRDDRENFERIGYGVWNATKSGMPSIAGSGKLHAHDPRRVLITSIASVRQAVESLSTHRC